MASIIGSILQLSPLARSAKNLLVANGKSSIGDVVIDATLSEVIDYSSSVTEHPIENKTAISDHIFKKPLKVKIEGYITDSPIRLMGLFDTPLQSNSLSSLIDNIKQASPFSTDARPSSEAYFALKQLYEQRSLITLVTKLEIFEDMTIERLSFSNDEDTGGRLYFTAELKQVRYAKIASSINVSPRNVNLQRITAEVTNRGVIPNATEIMDKEQKSKSFLNSAFDYFFPSGVTTIKNSENNSKKGSAFKNIMSNKYIKGFGEFLNQRSSTKTVKDNKGQAFKNIMSNERVKQIGGGLNAR